MRPGDIAELMRSLAVDVREFVTLSLGPIKQKQTELDAQLQAHQAERGEPGASAYELACAEGFTGSRIDWLQSLLGAPGKSVAAEDLRPMVDELVTAAAAKLPPPAAGQDGKSVTLEDVAPVVEEAVQRATEEASDRLAASVRATVGAAVAALPAPAPGADGVSLSPEDVRPMVDELVRSAVDALPPAADGKDGSDGQNGQDGASVTVDDVRPLLQQMVDAAAAQIPPPADGKSVTLDDVRPLVRELVDAAVAQMPVPADGKSVTIEDVQPLVQRAVGDAQRFGADDVHPLVAEHLAGFAAALGAKFASADHAG